MGKSPALVTPADTGSARNQAEPASSWMFGGAYAIFRSRSLLAAPVSPNNTTISRLNAGISSGLRLVTNQLAVTTSLSTQVPLALQMSVLSEGHEVSVRPLAASTSTKVHGPWQIAATGLPASKKMLRKTHGVGVQAKGVRIHDFRRVTAARHTLTDPQS